MEKNKKIKLKPKYKKILIAGLILLSLIIITLGFFLYFKAPVSNNYEQRIITISSGSSSSEIANLLKKEKLIKNKQFFLLYIKLHHIDNIYAASYYLSPNMSLKQIVDELKSGGHDTSEITITFKEGINMRKIANIISSNTNNSYDDVFNTLKDKTYIKSLISKYWFLSDSIMNQSIYYPLEGYLFPDTYSFSSKDVSVKEIFEVMLDQMNTVLTNYKKDIDKSSYSFHQLLTMASIVELEGIDESSRKGIAGVFYNRLTNGMSLGSDVTAYYAAKVDMGERDLYQSELEAYNSYNTRGPKMNGKLPIGPISCVSKESIEASLYPIKSDYLYFVADKNRKVYFTKTSSEHEAMIEKLQSEGLWYEW